MKELLEGMESGHEMKELIEQIVATKTRCWKLNEKEYREMFVQQVEAK